MPSLACTPTNRFELIDLCRGMLFALMASTHALLLAEVPASHWLYGSYWLPRGWATVSLIVLSGYGLS